MIGIINNYLPYFRLNVNQTKDTVIQDIFDFNAYYKLFDEDSTFMMEFSQKSMMFTKFIEESHLYL